MAIDLYNLEGTKTTSIDLPAQFTESFEADLIVRAYRAFQLRQRQPYGAYVHAGQGVSSKLSRRRRNYKGSYGIGIARSPRKTLWHRGTQFGWVGALAPNTVGGRRAHPGKPETDWKIKINKKENQKAIRSVLSGLAEQKHIVAVENGLEALKKSKDVVGLLEKLSIVLPRARRNNTGKARLRGRASSVPLGPVFVVSKNCPLTTAVRSLPGVDIHLVTHLNVAAFVKHPTGTLRQTIWTADALQLLQQKHLYAGHGGKQ